jgi:hypothetical protein
MTLYNLYLRSDAGRRWLSVVNDQHRAEGERPELAARHGVPVELIEVEPEDYTPKAATPAVGWHPRYSHEEAA